MSFVFSRLGLLIAEVVVVLGFAAHRLRRADARLAASSSAVVVLLSALSFGGLGLLIASRAQTIEGASGLMNVVMVPMWVLSGRLLLVRELSGGVPAVHQGAAAHRDERCAARDDAARRGLGCGLARAAGARRRGWSACGWLALQAVPLAMTGSHGQEPGSTARTAGARARVDRAVPRRAAAAIGCCPDVTPGDVAQQLPASPPGCRGVDGADSRRLRVGDRARADALESSRASSATSRRRRRCPGIVAEMLSAAVDVKAMLWKTSPAATELEQVVTDWLRQMLGLDDGWFGMTTDTASMSTMLALAAARESPARAEIRELGMAGRRDLPALRVYTSELAHSSVEKAALALGFGARQRGEDRRRRRVPHARRLDLRQAIERDLASGAACRSRASRRWAPPASRASTRFPPSPTVCAEHGVWLHVDAAYAGVAAILPEKREHPRRRGPGRSRSW